MINTNLEPNSELCRQIEPPTASIQSLSYGPAILDSAFSRALGEAQNALKTNDLRRMNLLNTATEASHNRERAEFENDSFSLRPAPTPQVPCIEELEESLADAGELADDEEDSLTEKNRNLNDASKQFNNKYFPFINMETEELVNESAKAEAEAFGKNLIKWPPKFRREQIKDWEDIIESRDKDAWTRPEKNLKGIKMSEQGVQKQAELADDEEAVSPEEIAQIALNCILDNALDIFDRGRPKIHPRRKNPAYDNQITYLRKSDPRTYRTLLRLQSGIAIGNAFCRPFSLYPLT